MFKSKQYDRFQKEYKRARAIDAKIQSLREREDIVYFHELPEFVIKENEKGEAIGILPKGVLKFLMKGPTLNGRVIFNQVSITAHMLWANLDILNLEINRAKQEMESVTESETSPDGTTYIKDIDLHEISMVPTQHNQTSDHPLSPPSNREEESE